VLRHNSNILLFGFQKERVMKKIVIGIDVSKEKLNFCLQLGEKVIEETVVENTTRAIISFLKGGVKVSSSRGS
jgi:hypothetical protein